MPALLLLLSPAANRVYQGTSPRLACAELAVTAPSPLVTVKALTIAGVDYLHVEGPGVDAGLLAHQSAAFAAFERIGDVLRPVELPKPQVMDSDLLTIPKYQGRTNEMFTRLLLHVTSSQVRTGREQLSVLDPLAGRGTTLLAAWTFGMNAYGVEIDERAVEQFSAFLKAYLRRKRLKHSAEVSPVRRDGRTLGERFDAHVRPAETTAGHLGVPGAPELDLTVFSGDTADSARLFGKRRFDAIVTDAPYGVVHGSTRASSLPRSRERGAGPRERSSADLLARAVPVWAGQLRPGGALGISWNTYGLDRAELARICSSCGLEVRDDGPWLDFAHRVDASIRRDIVVAVRPLAQAPGAVSPPTLTAGPANLVP
ncbi:Putative RNA methylase family UPF0020 [Propionibacterium cyclohexanicum]|uniref:Putative RNA methylase family UPF0020 n=1 Tax=Propionibacterium cyclohexanicum TaxID=64702 RepID=A0A1H9RV55_9ACTN|nr:site-specific DNA-methyltransferase [Propionibacterium cyclohexanicum]SER76606.1 Putative RNA methylase family UPF0020 [Propionibacterium cyclohexanicum]